MDKQGNIYLSILSLLLVFILFGLYVAYDVSSAAPAIGSERTPQSGNKTRDTTVNFTFIIIGDNSTYSVNLTSNWNEYPNVTVNSSGTDVDNNTQGSIFITNIPDSLVGTSGWDWQLQIDQQNDTNLSDTSENESTTTAFILVVDNSTPLAYSDTFTNGTNFKTNAVLLNLSVVENNPERAYLYIYNITDRTAEALLETNNFSYVNDTNIEYSTTLPDGEYIIGFGATDIIETDIIYWNETNKSILVDSTIPSLSLVNIGNNTYFNDTANINISFTVTDLFVSTCDVLLSNSTGSNFIGNSATESLNRTITNDTTTGIASGREFAPFDAGLILSETPVSTEFYVYSVVCNDTIGHEIFSENRSFVYDATIPADPLQLFPYNDSLTPDFTTNFTWAGILDTFFDVYNLRVYSDSSRTSTLININVSGNNTENHNLSFTDLPFNESTYFWEVFSIDLAGNMNVSAELFNFTTETNCANLSEGWNLCGIKRTQYAVNLSDIATEANADRVAILNASKDFQTFTGGFSTYSDIVAGEKDVVFIHINSTIGSSLWEDDFTTYPLNETEYFVNITNATSGYNVLAMPNITGMTFQDLENLFDVQAYSANGSISRLYYYNNTALKEGVGDSVFVDFKYQWNQTENFTIGWNEAFYLFFEPVANLNATTIALNFSCEPTSVYANNLNASDCGTG